MAWNAGGIGVKEPALIGQAAEPRLGAADCGERREAAGAIAEAVIRSVELIVQPDDSS
jgi:hypothetical protein